MRRLTGLLCGLILMAEAASAVPQWAFRIHFTDKAGSPALSAPAAFLSSRALQRRTLQGIAVTDADRPVSPTYMADMLSVTSGKMHVTSRWFNQCVVLLTDSADILQLQGKAYVAGIDYLGYFAGGLHRSTTAAGPAKATFSLPAKRGTGTSAHYGNTWSQTSMVNGDYLHDQGLTGQGQLIAVLDLGFNGTNTHPGFDSLRSQGRLLDAWNFVNASADIYSPNWDHGTSSLSAMAGWIPGSYVGSAPQAQYALYLTDDNSITDARYELDNFVAGLERADSLGADIITSSLGYFDFVHPSYSIYTRAELDGHTTLVARAANMAVARGIFTVVTAGNEGSSAWNFILTPGDADSVLTVGAVNASRGIAGFSSAGPNSSGRVKPDVVVQGAPAAIFTFGGLSYANGTSFSTPQVAGWAACLRQSKPGITPYQLRQAITFSADRATSPTPKEGYGIPDFKKALATVSIRTLPAAANGLIVRPNPFSDVLTLQYSFTKTTPVQCTLTDVSGRVVATHSFTGTQVVKSYSWDLPVLPAGTYLLQTAFDNQILMSKLARQ
jgi:hypothetical protein